MIGKKLKRSAKKITMPAELKERILEKCDTEETTENQEEITFTVEPFRPHRIRRIVSGAAAIAVAVGIAGYAGHLISRDGNFSGTETSTEITTEITTDETIPIPFANLNGRRIHFNGYRGILPSCTFDEEQSQQLAEFFSTVEWQSVPTDIPETMPKNASVATVNDMNFYYYLSEDDEINGDCFEYLTVNLDGRTASSHQVNKYDENGEYISGQAYYYKLDEKAFLDSIISLLYGDSDLAPPFDVSAVNSYTSALDDRQLTEDETAMIVDAFRGWNWSNEIDTKPDGEPEYIFTDGNFLEIAVYENDTVVVHNNKKFHGYSNVSGTQGNFCTYLKVLLDEYAEGYYYASCGLPFSDFTMKEYSFNGEVIPEKKRIKIAKSFSNYIWHRLDIQEDYMGGIAYQFTAEEDCITVYRDGVLECRNAENVTYYEINFEEVNKNFSDILYDGEFTENDVPFAENDDCTVNFSGYREFIPESELTETQTEKMEDFFSSLQWQEIEEPEIKGAFYPTDDTISFYKYKDGYNYSLSFSMNNLNLATYNVSGEIPLDDGMFREYNETKYFSIDENLIREAVAMNLADGADMYTPFGTLYKMTENLYFESELYTGEISGDKLKSLSTAFLGWDWSDVSDTIIEGTPEYTFANDEFTIYVFADGTVVWYNKESVGETPVYCYYNNVDGDDDPQRTTGNLCLMIQEILMDNNPVVKTT